MKCINKLNLVLLLIISTFLMTGCNDLSFDMPYDYESEVSAYSIGLSKTALTAKPFASDLCIVTGDKINGEEVESGEDSYAAAGLFNVNNAEVVYSRNALATLYPASMTKVLTALVAMENGNKDDIVIASENVYITESGATLCGLQAGDKLTLDQAMHAMLMYSGNDAAVVIAENIGGSVEEFSDMMNAEARRLGATNSHFVNPNGLHDENHYTTAYDMYLIFNEAVKYDWFNEIINMNSYSTNYTNANGDTVEMEIETTNKFLKGDVAAPTAVSVIGGKTGTTSAAGSNLVLLSRDSAGAPFISVVMKANDSATVYSKTSSLLDLCD